GLALGETPVYVVPDEVMTGVLGFKFHSGVMAVGRRPVSPGVDEVMQAAGERATLVILPEAANTENLGSMIRSAAAFGCTAMLLGERCCDPFYRQSVRVSMGTVFRVPIIRSTNLQRDLLRLKEAWRVDLVATVLDADAMHLRDYQRPPRVGVLFGNEAQGLPGEMVSLCDRALTIPMGHGTDSLNVAVAAGVFLYELTWRG